MRVFLVSVLVIVLFSNKIYPQEKCTELQIQHPEVFPIILMDDFPLIHDREKIYSDREYRKLRRIISNFYVETSNQVLIITIDSLGPYQDIQRYATDCGNFYGIGKFNKNNGLVIALNKNQGKVGLATCLGTELILTDEICQQVINQEMIPYFKKEKYYIGVKKSLEKLIIKWKKSITHKQ